MLRTFLNFFTSFLICVNLNSQVPEKIYGKNKVLKSNDYYLEQIDLWKKEIDKRSKNPDAWYNYYLANRNAYIVGEEEDSQKAKGKSRFERLESIVHQMEKKVPKSYEFNYVKWLNGYNDLSLYPYLEKAHKLSPESPEPIMSLIFYYEIKGDYSQRNKFIKQYYDLGEYSPGLLNYSYNLLSGLEENAIIFTEGDKDTEAALLLQFGKGFRSDIRIMNINLLMIKEYRDHVFKELEIDTLGYDPMENNEGFEKFRQTIVEHVTKNKNTRTVHVAVNVRDVYTNKISEKLYLTGLTYLYSNEKIENLLFLKRNVEELYKLDYLSVYFPKDISIGNVHSMNENYILPFSVLSKEYKRVGNLTKAESYERLANKVAIAANRMDLFEHYFNKE